MNFKRRDFLKLAGISIASGIGGLGCYRKYFRDNKRKRPNIIFLLTDDQRFDTMGCADNPVIKTANMDDMANNGVTFTDAFVTTAICCSSRASIFSGQYTRRHGIDDFAKGFSPEALSQTYPVLLKKAGYKIGFIGKYGLQGEKLAAEQYHYWKGWPGQGKYEHKDKKGNYKHLTQTMGEQSIQFLQGCSKSEPFCLSVSFKAPHAEDGNPRQFIYDKAYENLYKDVTIAPPKTGDDKYWHSFPDFFKKNNEGRARWQRRFSTPQLYQQMVKGYYRLITGVDIVIGQIRDELKKLGFEDNTVIILASDNGFYLGEHGLAGKWYGHKESIRIPLIVYDPRLPKNMRSKKIHQIALNIDIAPTILSMAGLSAPSRMQGKDLIPLINGKTDSWRKDFFYEHLFDFENKIPKSEGVVGRRYKYMRFIEAQPHYEQLFDLKNDPDEITNLATDPEYKYLLEEMRIRCSFLAKEIK